MKVRNRTRRHNQPRELTSFIGRERELTELRSLLQTTPLLVATGGVRFARREGALAHPLLEAIV